MQTPSRGSAAADKSAAPDFGTAKKDSEPFPQRGPPPIACANRPHDAFARQHLAALDMPSVTDAPRIGSRLVS